LRQLGKTSQCPQGPDVRLTCMSNDFTRRELLKSWGLIVGAGVVAPQPVFAEVSKPTPSSKTDSLIRLSLNENPYVFFDAGRPQPILAAAMRERGVEIGRAHPPYTNWARITIGLPSENLLAQNALRAGLKET
jgi:hypothetical protein